MNESFHVEAQVGTLSANKHLNLSTALDSDPVFYPHTWETKSRQVYVTWLHLIDDDR